MDKVSNISHIFLTGGGLKGLCYLGIIRYLYLENMIRNIKHIVGTSIGAYFGMIIGLKIPIDFMEEEIGNIIANFSDHMTVDHRNLSNLFDKNGIFTFEAFFVPILSYMKKEFDADDITFVEFAKKTGVNLYVNATNLNNAQRVTFSTDNTPNASVISAVKASMSVPFLYQPVLIDGEYFMDSIISSFEILDKVDKNSKLIVILPMDSDTDTAVYPKRHEFNFLEHFIRVNEIMINMIYDDYSDSEEIFKVGKLVYDKFLKFSYTDKTVYVDITKKDMDDMIVQGFVEFSVYMKKRYARNDEFDDKR